MSWIWRKWKLFNFWMTEKYNSININWCQIFKKKTLHRWQELKKILLLNLYQNFEKSVLIKWITIWNIVNSKKLPNWRTNVKIEDKIRLISYGMIVTPTIRRNSIKLWKGNLIHFKYLIIKDMLNKSVFKIAKLLIKKKYIRSKFESLTNENQQLYDSKWRNTKSNYYNHRKLMMHKR
jgi:hypothetical protein